VADERSAAAVIQEIEFAPDSPLEGDGFEPSVPGTKEPVFVAEGELRGPNGGSQKGLFLMRYRWFESISLQRRVICEPDFLDLAQEPPAAALRCNCRGRLDRRHPRSYPELRLSHGLAAWRVKTDCDTLPGTNRWRHARTGVGEIRARCPCTMCPGMHFW
jgi:hypothetical protein